MRIGIQGGKGSFNEEAVVHYLSSHDIEADIEYLFTTESVLAALEAGRIDRGQFAIHNSVGGIVEESVRAMGAHLFEVEEEFAIEISHTLMALTGKRVEDIKTIMAHPQVFAQCKETLSKKYPHLTQTSGAGDLIDGARAAEALTKGELAPSTAVMGSRVIAEVYGLDVLDSNLQDADRNLTSFLIVERRKG